MAFSALSITNDLSDIDTANIVFLEAISDLITSNKNDSLESYIANNIPSSYLSNPDSFKLLNALIQVAIDAKNEGGARILLQAWDMEDIIDRRLEVELLLSTYFDDMTLLYIFRIRKAFYLDLMTELIKASNTPEYEKAILRLENIFGKPPPNVYKILIQYSEEAGNTWAYYHFRSLYHEVSPVVPPPPWVRSIASFPNLSTDDVTPMAHGYIRKELSQKPLPPLERILDFFVLNLQSLGFPPSSIEFTSKALQVQLPKMNENELRKLAEPLFLSLYYKDLDASPFLFQLLGPANPLVGGPEEDIYEGRDRMFLSTYFEPPSQNTDPLRWFEGYCYQCDSRIPYYWWAVRLPVLTGGWKGTYCSFECMEKAFTMEERMNGTKLDMVMPIFLAKMKEKMLTIGIAERQEVPKGANLSKKRTHMETSIK